MPDTSYVVMKLADLNPAAYNPRKITDEALIGLENTIEEFGLVQNLVWNARTKNLVGGHQRMKALANQNVTEAMVCVVDIPLEREKALNVALNNPHIAGTFDDGLQELLEGIRDDDAHLFRDVHLDKLLAEEAVGNNAGGAGGEGEPDHPDDDNVGDASNIPELELGKSYQVGRHTIHCGECIEVLKSLPDESVDSIVTDPPYGIGFMGKSWDVAVPGEEWAKECLRVLKPGGHIIAFAATRTVHRLAVAIEDAGFEIRDTISWLYWQGFPKSLDVSKAIDKAAGVEFSSKPASGVGFMNNSDDGYHTTLNQMERSGASTESAKQWNGWGTALKPAQEPAILARKPLIGTVAENVLKHCTGAVNVDACRMAPGDPSWPGPQAAPLSWDTPRGGIWTTDSSAKSEASVEDKGRWPANIYVCPKPAGSEKSEGLGGEKNFHATVKPVRLMRWLIRLVTPPGGVVVDSFLGSGTTMISAEREGFDCIGIELDPKYAGLAMTRVKYICDDGGSDE